MENLDAPVVTAAAPDSTQEDAYVNSGAQRLQASQLERASLMKYQRLVLRPRWLSLWTSIVLCWMRSVRRYTALTRCQIDG